MATVLITGVNRGIGLEFLKQYAAAGWTVIGTCRDLAKAEAANVIAESRDGVTLHSLDVTDVTAVNALAQSLSGTTIDVLILNAGAMSQASATLGKIDAQDFLRILEVNVVSPLMCAQAFTPHVSASDRGVMVGLGSFLGSLTNNTDGSLYSYRASKSGIHAVMRSLSIDLRDAGVLAIPIHPGWVQTDMGGENATISAEASVSGMRAVIEGLTPEKSGRLWTYAGEEMPW